MPNIKQKSVKLILLNLLSSKMMSPRIENLNHGKVIYSMNQPKRISIRRLKEQERIFLIE